MIFGQPTHILTIMLAGVTTNSSSGVISYEPFYPVFKAMEEEGLVSKPINPTCTKFCLGLL